MQWSNYYLIPILLIGGLLAFGAGRTIVAGFLAMLSAPFKRKAAKEKDDGLDYVNLDTAPHKPYREPKVNYESVKEWIAPARKLTLAERQAEWDARALALADEREAEVNRLRALDLEEARIAALREENRKASKSTNVLIGKLQVDPTAGPLTTAIQLTEANLAMIKAAAAERDAKSPKS